MAEHLPHICQMLARYSKKSCCTSLFYSNFTSMLPDASGESSDTNSQM